MSDYRSLTSGFSGMLRGVRDSFAILDAKQRREAVGILMSMVLNACLGLFGLAALLPFIQLMLVPNPFDGDGVLARTLRLLNLTQIDTALTLMGLLIIALVVVKNIYSLLHLGLQNSFCARAEAKLSCDLLDRIINAPFLWVLQRNSSILRDAVVGSSIEWSRGVIRPVLQAINDILFILMAFGLILWASPGAGLLVGLAACLLTFLLFRLTRARIFAHAERKRRAIRVAGATATEAIAGGRDVRVSNVGEGMLASFRRNMAIYGRSDGRGRQWLTLPRLGIEVIAVASIVGVTLGALWTGVPRTEIATLLALYVVVAMRAIPMLGQIMGAATTVTDSLPAVAELRGLLRELPTAGPAPSDDSVPVDWKHLAIDDASFIYPGNEKSVLGPVSIVIERGTSCGVVGMSGAGKSTLVDLLAGLIPPTQGTVRLDEHVLATSTAKAWRRRIAYVSQAPFLLDGTLQDNIEFGQPRTEMFERKIGEALEAAGLGDFVRSLADGLATTVGERGARLSGGQRQRIAIARALYRGADVLVLDEATSALDSLTEREIVEEIEALKGRVTVIVVAHRLSTIAHLDSIIVLDEGRVVARGRHDELIAASPDYRRMVEAQSIGGSGSIERPLVQAG